MVDTLGQPIKVGSNVIVAKTGSQRGISWKRGVVVRVSDKRFWTRGKYGEEIRKPSNCLVIDKLLPKEERGALNTAEMVQNG